METEIEAVLVRAGVSFRKTKRAEKVSGFDQAPDFIVPDEFNPQVVIEAKIAEDDGTARDKVTRMRETRSLASSTSTACPGASLPQTSRRASTSSPASGAGASRNAVRT